MAIEVRVPAYPPIAVFDTASANSVANTLIRAIAAELCNEMSMKSTVMPTYGVEINRLSGRLVGTLRRQFQHCSPHWRNTVHVRCPDAGAWNGYTDLA